MFVRELPQVPVTSATMPDPYTPPDGTWNVVGGIAAQAASSVTLTSIGTAQTIGWTVTNTTSAGAGAQQYSPMAVLTGQGWRTNATAASQAVDYAWQVQPVQGAASPTGNLFLYSRVNSGSWVQKLSFIEGGGAGGTLYIPGNAGTATTPAAIWVDDAGGESARFDWEGLGTAQTVGVSIRNNTDAAAGAQQFSPLFMLRGAGWKTNATAASQLVDFAMQNQTFQGTSAPSGDLVWSARINNGSWLDIMDVDSIGNFYVLSTITCEGLLYTSSSVRIAGDFGAGQSSTLTITNATGLGDGVAGNMTAPAKGGGSGPTTMTVAKWLKVYDGTTARWVPSFV